jgi:tetratricopeptide (TPR) repeat protein
MINNPRNHRVFEFWRLTIVCILCASMIALRSAAASEGLPADVEKVWKVIHVSPKRKCLDEARAGLAKNPNSAEWQELMAACLCVNGDVSAVQYAEKALCLKPKSARIMTTCALVALSFGNMQRAFRLASRAIKIDPLDGRAFAVLGTYFFNASDEAAATESFARALQFSPSDFDVNFLALKYYGHLLDDRALECATRLVENYPKSAEAYFERAQVKRGQKDATVALPDYDKALALDPTFLESRIYRGKLLERLERHKEAILDFDKVLAITPNAAALHARRANSLLNVRETKKALEDLNAAIRIANRPFKKDERVFLPKETTLESKVYMGCWIKRMDAEIDLGYQELTLKDATEILKIDHACDAALSVRQSLLRKTGRYLEAIADLDILIKLSPDASDWYEARADAYKKLNRPEEAAADFAKAKHIDEFGK